MRIELILTGALILAGLSQPQRSRCGGNERNPSATLKTLTSAEVDFRANDRDGNGVHDFWARDVAGLYALQRNGEPLRLIERSVAAADSAPTLPIDSLASRSPKAGYWYKAIRPAGGPDPISRFAYCAYPAGAGPGFAFVYVVDENNTIYRARLDRVGVPDAFPSGAEFAKHWSKMD